MSALILPRRRFLQGLVSLITAPAVVRASALMPIAVWRPKLAFWQTKGAIIQTTFLTCDKDDLLGVDLDSLGLPTPLDMDPEQDWAFNEHQWYWALDSLPRDKVQRLLAD
jgi:hypothetical protein